MARRLCRALRLALRVSTGRADRRKDRSDTLTVAARYTDVSEILPASPRFGGVFFLASKEACPMFNLNMFRMNKKDRPKVVDDAGARCGTCPETSLPQSKR